MYQRLIKLNKNHGYATDEHNNISIVTKENDGYELEDILNKENSLEELDLELKEINKHLSNLKSNNKFRAGYSILVFLFENFLYFEGCAANYSSNYIFSIMGISYLFTKMLVTIEFGTWIGSFIKKKKILKSIEGLETKRTGLISELQKMKETTGYQVHHESEIDWTNNVAVKYKFAGKPMNHDEGYKATEFITLRLINKSQKKYRNQNG